MAALICGGDTEKLAAICGSEVEMIEESSPSMKNAPATTKGTMNGRFACGGSSFDASLSATIQREPEPPGQGVSRCALVYGTRVRLRQAREENGRFKICPNGIIYDC